jgi:hypothetical protein
MERPGQYRLASEGLCAGGRGGSAATPVERARRYDCSRPTVGGEGKPVRVRRGPATVIGDASRTAPHGASH